MDQVIQDGFRYLDRMPEEIYRLTHREFYLLIGAAVEKKYDNLEMMSFQAVMNGGANNTKKKSLKPQDLFKRPKEPTEQETPEQIKRRIHDNQQFLDSLNIGKGGEHVG